MIQISNTTHIRPSFWKSNTLGTLFTSKRSLSILNASAVLQVPPKDLQNLVQFGVVKPQRSAGTYFLDMKVLLAAKVALYLKECLGTRTSVLSKLMDAFSASEEEFRTQNPNYVVFSCRLKSKEEPGTGRGANEAG
jgi:hypothetical protein